MNSSVKPQSFPHRHPIHFSHLLSPDAPGTPVSHSSQCTYISGQALYPTCAVTAHLRCQACIVTQPGHKSLSCWHYATMSFLSGMYNLKVSDGLVLKGTRKCDGAERQLLSSLQNTFFCYYPPKALSITAKENTLLTVKEIRE